MGRPAPEMGHIRHPDVQNVVMTRRARSSARVLALLVVAVLAVTGCGEKAEAPPQQPALPKAGEQTAVPVPGGVTLTEYGTELDFGESAVVAYSPNPKRRSILEVTVQSVKQVSISEFKTYRLEERTKRSTPYFVKVRVKNVGEGDVGQTPIPLYLADNRTPPVLINPSTFDSVPFAKCPSPKLSASFGPGDTMDACLVYLAPDGGRISAMSFRAIQEFAPILWTGDIAVAKALQKGKKGQKGQKPATKKAS